MASDHTSDVFQQQALQELIEVFLLIDSKELAQAFLRDLCTENELREFAMRWKVAKMLHAGIPYTQIESETGLSSTTIARISKWLASGAGGYREMLSRLNSHA